MRRLTFAREARGDAEPGQPHLAGRLVEQDVGRLDVLVDEAALVELTENRSHTDGPAQEASYLHRAAPCRAVRCPDPQAPAWAHQHCSQAAPALPTPRPDVLQLIFM